MDGNDVDDDLTYEAAVTELEAIVTALQRDDVSVDELAERVARGATLVEVCRARLHAAELAVEEVVAALRASDDAASDDAGASSGR
ncbi:MAG: exodeoxyribonuclease VII small subunit [Nitriliruptoraceae bacterium]